jgi:hypothetical protein
MKMKSLNTEWNIQEPTRDRNSILLPLHAEFFERNDLSCFCVTSSVHDPVRSLANSKTENKLHTYQQERLVMQ